jgi:hypothetical protein
VVYTSVYSSAGPAPDPQPDAALAATGAWPKPTPKGMPWGGLLLELPVAARYSGLAEAELLDLHARGVLPGVAVGVRLSFRRGDLANLSQRLRPRPRKVRRRF